MIVGIVGKKRSGKNLLGGYFAETLHAHGYKVVQRGFADKLKFYASKYFINSPHVDMYDDVDIKEKWRFLLQGIGVMFRGEVDSDYWVKILLNDIKDEDITVITDVRFENEMRAIKNAEGVLIKINRSTNSLDTHISETEMDGVDESYYDFVVDNNGSKSAFQEEALLITKHLMNKWKRVQKIKVG